jgi:hypothetical protein
VSVGHVGTQAQGARSGSCDRQQPEYQINVTIAVADPQALWTAAAARLLDAPDMTLDDVLDMIGPREDPSIGDCIATLAQPVAVAGCKMDDYWIDSLEDHRLQIEKGSVGTLFKRATTTASRRPPRARRSGPRLALCPPPVLQSDAPVI